MLKVGIHRPQSVQKQQKAAAVSEVLLRRQLEHLGRRKAEAGNCKEHRPEPGEQLVVRMLSQGSLGSQPGQRFHRRWRRVLVGPSPYH